MKKLGVITIFIALAAGQSFGLTFMGPPVATLRKDYWAVDVDCAYMETDIEVDGEGVQGTLDGVEQNTAFAKIGYGLDHNWECFVRLGLAVLNVDDFSGDAEFACGLGTKATFFSEDNVRFGGLCQIFWFESEDDLTFAGYSGVAEFDMYEFQMAVGPTFESDGIKVYCGPFLHWIGGELNIKGPGTSFSFDIGQGSEYGAYIGLTAKIRQFFNLCVEYQFTGDAQGVGLGTAWLF